MFCFQTPFGKRERERTTPKNFLSESEKNLNKLSYKTPCLCLSDSNIAESGVHSGSKKWERWRANAQIGYHMSLLLKSKNKSQKEKIVESSDRRKSNENLGFEETSTTLYDLLTKNVGKNGGPEENNILVSPSLNPFQASDIEFIDESDNGLVSGGQEIKNSDSEFAGSDEYLENHKSIITNAKAINNNPIHSENSPGILKKNIFVRSESENNLNDTEVILHVSSKFGLGCKSNSSNEMSNGTNSPKSANSNSKQQPKTNSGSSFLSFCSLFHLPKSPSVRTKEDNVYTRNNEISAGEEDGPGYLITANVSCCPLSSYEVKHVPVEVSSADAGDPVNNIVIINKSPKPKNKLLFSNGQTKDFSDPFERGSGSCFGSDSSSGETSSDGVAPMASPEVISPAESVVSSPILSGYSSHGVSPEMYNDGINGSNFPSPLSTEQTVPQMKLKLLHEGDVQVCYLNHTKTIVSKVLSSKYLRRWETHHVYLTNDCITSKTPSGFLESPVPYSKLDEVYVVGRWDQGNRYCIRLVMANGSLLLQTSNSLVRDQWLSSIIWKKNMYKYRNILQTSKRPEVILKEIKGLIYSSLNSSLQDDCISSVPIEIISKVLGEDEIWNDRQRTEEVIVALAPLLEDSTPSPKMFQFFSRHCLCHPRSPVVVDIFTAIVQRILKRTMDFGKSPLMRRFVADYFKALHSQNDGDEAVRKFIASIHGTSCGCPHPRVLPNLVAVNLAAVFSHFEQRKTLLAESGNETNCAQAVQLLDKQLECFVTLFLSISEFEDWRPGLAQLLQPIPFPDDALSHETFIKGLTPAIRRIGTDPRCNVHEMVLGIRENKEGWLNVFCPSSLVCKDEGLLWCQMLQTLFDCCCRRKSFLQKMVKHLGALLLVALRDHGVAQEILCLMLEWRLIVGKDQEMQVVTTLQSTSSGRQKYGELCKRQEHLKELQKEGGPKKLTLPSRSTDADLAQLLSCGSFGNLECLSLAFTHVTSACAHHLIKLPKLRYLNLWATQFGDAGLIVIAEHLDKLQVLNLCETPVSDKGISAISAMRGLKKLNLNSTKLSPQTLDTLKQKLPTLQELDVRYTDAW